MLGIYVRQENQHGYMQTLITVRSGYTYTLEYLLEGCVNNKAGYGGGQATADGIAAKARQHIHEGYVEQFETDMFDTRRINFDARYQHFDTYYCQPHLTFNGSAESALASAAFLTSITKKTFPKSPAELLTRLKNQRRHKIVYLDYLDGSLLSKPLQIVGTISAGV